MTCGTCAHASPWKSGFLRCAFMKPWEFLAERCVCVLDPVRWAQRKEGVLL